MKNNVKSDLLLPSISRRQWLLASGLAGAACWANGLPAATPDEHYFSETSEDSRASRREPLPSGGGLSWKREAEVVVAGAGVAGVAAAVACARAGRRTLLIDKAIIPGGLATGGLITWYSPICDGLGHKITLGLAEEMLLNSVKYGPGWLRPWWLDNASADLEKRKTSRHDTVFNAMSMVLTLDELLDEAGVELLYDSRVCGAVLNGDRLVGIEVENSGGRGLISCDCCIDATGGADIAFRAGVPCVEGKNTLAMKVLEMNRQADKPTQWFNPKAAERADKRDKVNYPAIGGDELTAFALRGRRAIREEYARRQAELGENGRSELYPLYLPTIPQFRKVRRIEGLSSLNSKNVNKPIDDSVGLMANWWVGKKGEVFEIPYGCLLPRGVKGLLAAGRCVSAGGWGWEMTRIIHACVHTGEIAGIAAAAAVERNTVPDALSVDLMQAEVRRRGLLFKISQIPTGS